MNALILMIILSANLVLTFPREGGYALVPRIFDIEMRSGGGFASGQTNEKPSHDVRGTIRLKNDPTESCAELMMLSSSSRRSKSELLET